MDFQRVELAGAGAVSDLQFHPDGQFVFTAGDGKIRIWRMDPLELAGELDAPDCTRLVIHADGMRVAAHDGSTVTAWDLAEPAKLLEARPKRKAQPMYHPAMDDLTSEEIDAHTLPASVRVIGFAGEQLVVGTSADGFELYALASGARTPVRTGRLALVLPDGRRALAHAISTGLEVWDLGAAPIRLRAFQADLYFPSSESFLPHPDGRRLIVAYKTFRAYDLASGDGLVESAPLDDSVLDAVCHPDGEHVLGASRGGALLVWNLARNTVTPLARRDDRRAHALAAHPPTGRLLALGDRALDAWTVGGAPLDRVPLDAAHHSLRVSPSGVVALWGDGAPLLMIPA